MLLLCAAGRQWGGRGLEGWFHSDQGGSGLAPGPEAESLDAGQPGRVGCERSDLGKVSWGFEPVLRARMGKELGRGQRELGLRPRSASLEPGQPRDRALSTDFASHHFILIFAFWNFTWQKSKFSRTSLHSLLVLVSHTGESFGKDGPDS